MRGARKFLPFVLLLLLGGCVSSLLIGNQFQSRLMWAVLKPLVGFDPNEVNLSEVPVVKERMTALLGSYYAPTVKLLRTADEIQQEGALIYLASQVITADELPLPAELEAARKQAQEVHGQIKTAQDQVEQMQGQAQVVQSAAGMVWNSDTNQLAVLLVEQGITRVFAEQPAGAEVVKPVWPESLQPLVEPGEELIPAP